MQEHNIDGQDKPNDPSGKILTWLERIALFFVFWGIVFKVLHWAGAGFISILALSALSMVYFLLWVKPISEKKSGINVFVSILAFGGMSVGLMGILFKLMFWPGAHMMLYTAILIGLVTLVMCAVGLLKEDSGYDRSTIRWILTRQIPVMLVMITLVSVNQITYYKNFGPLGDNEEFMQLYEDCHYRRENCEEKRAYLDSAYFQQYVEPQNHE